MVEEDGTLKKIADGIALLDLSVAMGNQQMVVHPTLLWDDKDVILVDTGFPGMLTSIRDEMERAGFALERLSKVILTHQDYDHIGGLPEIQQSVGPVEVLAHDFDRPYIEGEKLLIKHDPSRGTPPRAKVDQLIGEGDILPYAGGLRVIFTPGHTPGHISLYHPESQSLITGDATVSNDGELLGPNEKFTPDMPLALKSLARFTDFDIKTALCYHGGICDHDVNAQFARLATRA